jgi:hypothetical protein
LGCLLNFKSLAAYGSKAFSVDCALVGIRTPNLLIRSEMLYPIELQMHFPRFGTAKVVFVIEIQNFFK